jgi:hypothetical protein
MRRSAPITAPSRRLSGAYQTATGALIWRRSRTDRIDERTKRRKKIKINKNQKADERTDGRTDGQMNGRSNKTYSLNYLVIIDRLCLVHLFRVVFVLGDQHLQDIF